MEKPDNRQPITISVIVPAYNVQEHIGRAIESILAQTHQPDEIIVVDDGSTDGTAEKIKEFGNKVTYIHQANAGPGAARNTGIKAAGCDWVAFLDADDEWLPEYLQKQSQLLTRNPDLNWSSANSYRCLCDEDRRKPELNPAKATALLAGKDFFDSYFLAYRNRAGGNTDTMVIRRKVFGTIGFFREDCNVAEDIDLWWRIACQYPKIGYIAEPLAVYHLVRKASLTGTFGQMNIDTLCRVLSDSIREAEKHNHLAEFEPIISALVTSWIRALLFENRPDDIRRLIDRFGQYLARHFKIMIKLLLVFPALTAATCHLISRIVRALGLRKRIVRKPSKNGKQKNENE